MKTFKKTLALFLATLMIVSAFAAYSVFATTNENEPAAASEPAAQDEGNSGTATQGWGAETRDGVTAFYIDTIDDFIAFHDNSQTNTWYTDKTKPVKLTADIDLSKTEWTWGQVASFRGEFDGQGHTIKNLSLTTHMFGNMAVNAKIKNVKFIGGGITSSSADAAIFTSKVLSGNTVYFDNVYMEMDITGTTNVSAFISRLNTDPYTNTSTGKVTANKIVITNCVNNCTIKATATSGNTGTGGFIGTVENGNILQIEDSAFMGSINGAAVRNGGFVGYVGANCDVDLTDCVSLADMTNVAKYSGSIVGNVIGNTSLTRCVSMSKESSVGAGYYGGLYYGLNNVEGAPVIDVELTDCYAAINLHGAYARHSTADANGVSIKYGESTAYAVKTIATKDGATLTAANFKAVCPELAANDWVVTTKTVTYGTDLNVPEILPSTVATMLGRTVISESPVNAEVWNVKDNDDTVDIRFLGTIKEDADHLAAYQNVGIKITIVEEGKANPLADGYLCNSENVYTALTYDGVRGVGEDGEYVFAAEMRGFAKTSTYTVTFIAYATYNDVDIYDYDGATTITVTNGEIVNN